MKFSHIHVITLIHNNYNKYIKLKILKINNFTSMMDI